MCLEGAQELWQMSPKVTMLADANGYEFMHMRGKKYLRDAGSSRDEWRACFSKSLTSCSVNADSGPAHGENFGDDSHTDNNGRQSNKRRHEQSHKPRKKATTGKKAKGVQGRHAPKNKFAAKPLKPVPRRKRAPKMKA